MSIQFPMRKISKKKKGDGTMRKKTFFKKIKRIEKDNWIICCPNCKKDTKWQIRIGTKSSRLYLICNECKATYISPDKVKKK